ncbi:hypothetical protein [Pedobacter cryoconitis]|uniref:Uncharacterized protein n=1 Tax=Pedobacter cryoconitis TaxID=188932 RepID=A0A327T177_9SPHI|nr:hypothetical protein [Pedobacter cryoconitis]RAJ35390.1 hypothetical protein LY11_00633 [Pedobacter cryoconitis]
MPEVVGRSLQQQTKKVIKRAEQVGQQLNKLKGKDDRPILH